MGNQVQYRYLIIKRCTKEHAERSRTRTLRLLAELIDMVLKYCLSPYHRTFYWQAALICHPQMENRIVSAIAVRVNWAPDGRLALTYTLTGDCAQLCIPSPKPAASVDGLWQHTCFEAFVSIQGDSAYREFNFSPSGEWAVYCFRDYRDRLPAAVAESVPEIITCRHDKGVELDARVRLPDLMSMQPLRLALSAVIKDTRGALSYWALKHPLGNADFHHPEAFVLEIDPLPEEIRTGDTR